MKFSKANSLSRVTMSHNKVMNTVQIYVVAAKMDLEKLTLFTAGETKRFKLYYCYQNK